MGILRFFLAAYVVVWHSKDTSSGWVPFNGTACVILFFIISGFYMTLVLNEKYNSKQFILFWQNRYLRLWPSFFIVTILMAIFVYPDLITKAYNETSLPTFFTIILSNFTMFAYEIKDIGGLNSDGNLIPYNSNVTPINNYFYLQPGWSLGLELWFYLLAPLIVRSFFKTLVVFFIGVSILIFIKIIGYGQLWEYRFFPPVISFFLLGSLSYHLSIFMKKNIYKEIYYNIGYKLVLPLTILLLTFPNILDNLIVEQHRAKFFMLIFFLFIPAWFISTKHSSFDNIIGSTSFPIYLIHPFIIYLFHDYSESLFFFIITIIFSTIASFIIIYTLEKPIDKWRQRRILDHKNTIN